MAGTLLLGSIYLYSVTMPRKIDPQAYQPLLDTIAQGESKGNYNAFYGHAGNIQVRFTEMSINEVLRWQEEFVKSGQPSSAVGKYQIIRPTLAGLVQDMKIEPTESYSEAMQDKMAIKLLERRGAMDYANDKLSREQFAANIAQEWAALPRTTGPNPDDSYYAGDGLNKALVTREAVFQALDLLKTYDRNVQK
jgi:conjugal transfer mating pair stabilization protein TraG